MATLSTVAKEIVQLVGGMDHEQALARAVTYAVTFGINTGSLDGAPDVEISDRDAERILNAAVKDAPEPWGDL